MTTAIPQRDSTKQTLSTLLQRSLEHLQSPVLDFSPVYFLTIVALQEHATQQLASLQTEIAHLQSKRQEYLDLIQTDEREQRQRQQQQQQQHVLAQKNSTGPATDSIATSTTITTNAGSNKIQSSKSQAVVAPNNQPESHLAPLELQKKALMEKRRQEVLEQRKKAAAEQKRKKEEERKKFLEYEQRKQDLKLQAAREAAFLKEKAQHEEIQRKAIDAAQAAFPQPSPKIQDNSKAPLASPDSVRTTPLSVGTNSPVMPTEASRHTSIGSNAGNTHIMGGMNLPNLPSQPLPATSSDTATYPSPIPPNIPRSAPTQPPEPTMPSHTPSGTDEKYRSMVSQPLEPPAPSATPEHVITALKHNVLLQWALLPPGYQILKPIPQLLCQIHTIYPPSLGLPSHDYFQEWTPIVWSELATQSAWDPIKLKKAVRKVRFFLHPDKLPRDLSDAQQFLCKLLWDVVNDAYEDYELQMAASTGTNQVVKNK